MKSPNNITNDNTMVSLVIDDESLYEMREAVAAVQVGNPAATFVKFILTDDKPNGNKQRIPVEEFENLIKTGVFMPIKKAKGYIARGHENSQPIGVITHLRQLANKIIGLAALWSYDNNNDVAEIKARLSNGAPVNLSWEILYDRSDLDQDGVENLRGVALYGATIVGDPAYGGRTPILAMASKWGPAYLKKLPDENFLFVSEDSVRKYPYIDIDGNVDSEELRKIIDTPTIIDEEELRSALVAKAQDILDSLTSSSSTDTMEDSTLDVNELEAKVAELELKVQELTETISAKDEAISSINDELTSLREYKATIEANEARANKLASIKQKFADRGIFKDDSYFADNGDSLIAMDERTFDFVLQELAAFAALTAQAPNNDKQSEASSQIPPLQESDISLGSIKDIGKALRILDVK